MSDKLILEYPDKAAAYLEKKLFSKMKSNGRMTYMVRKEKHLTTTIVIKCLTPTPERFFMNLGLDIANTLLPYKRIYYRARLRKFKRVIDACEKRIEDVKSERLISYKNFAKNTLKHKELQDYIQQTGRVLHNAKCKMHACKTYSEMTQNRLKLLLGE